jgi:hypothetical protein
VIGIEWVGTIVGSISGVDLSKLVSTTDGDGTKIYIINLALKIALAPKDGALTCKLLLRGREIGDTTIDFSYR